MKKRMIALLLACVTVAGVTSIAWAAVGDGGTIKTCYKTASATWRPIDSSASCKSGETQLDFYSKAGADAAFVQGRGGSDYRTVAHTGSFFGPVVPGPFGTAVETGCRVGTSHSDYVLHNGRQTDVSVFEQVNGGTPSFFTLVEGSNTPDIEASIERRTWEITDGTDSGEVDVWTRWNGSSCDFIIDVSFGKS